MKSVLISIQPYYVFLIIARLMGWNIPENKTVEVRKNFPKDLTWNKKAHIYCSKNKKSFNRIPAKYQPLMARFLGKVIGEFVCDKIECVNAQCSDMGIDLFYHDSKKYGCLTQKEVEQYFGVYDYEHNTDLRDMKGNGYAWHISNLKIYDKPKELGEFRTICKDVFMEKYDGQVYYFCKNGYGSCVGGESCGYEDYAYCLFNGLKPLTRPFQSWGYVEEL